MNPNDATHVKRSPVIRFRADTTLRWPMRDGDTLIWFRCPNPTCDTSNMPVGGSWNLRDGDKILLTNRVVDIPLEFQLHPDEVCNAQCLAALPRFENATPWAMEHATGQHIWRVREGDRLVWIGDPREGLEGKDGILAVLDCRASMLVLGEPIDQCESALAAFGTGYNTKTPPLILHDRVKLAFEAAFNLGASRTMGLQWQLGDGEEAPTMT